MEKNYEAIYKFSLDLLNQDGFLHVSKSLIHLFDLHSAIFLADLISKEKYFKDRKKLEDGWFYNTEENREHDTSINPYMQRKVIKVFKQKGILETKRQGLPAKTYFRIVHEKLQEILEGYYSGHQLLTK